MMTKEEVFNKVKDIIVDQLDVDADKIKEDTNFKNDLDLDSLDIFEVVDKIEDTYDIEIETDEGMETVGDLVDYVLKQQTKQVDTLRLSYLFSGQGKQFPEMGQDLYQQEAIYRQTIEEASAALNMDLSKSEVMDDPNNVQVAIVAMSTGIFRILEKEFGSPVGAAGLSLGEYSAIIAARGVQFADALKLVRDRSRYMDKAGKDHPGKMAAVLKANADLVREACRVGAQAGDIYPANFNTDSQIVIGGTQAGLDAATTYLHEHGIKRVVPLKMTVASHTPFMQEASDLLADRIQTVDFHEFKFPVISNTTMTQFDVANMKQTLVDQLVNPTHFIDCLKALVNLGSDTMIEIGPGDTLMKFAKSLSTVDTLHIDSVKTLNDVRSNVKLVK